MMETNKTLETSPLAPKTYIVGGAVRDQLMGLPVTDFDYVVEATKAEFEAVFPDAPLVGNDFPVYIIEGDEVALTRTERSTGEKYGDFEVTGVGVSIHADLGRRDFTINAIARNIVTGDLVDPFGGVDDIKKRRMRLVSNYSFQDDPVRILRGCRLAARFEFTFTPETSKYMLEDRRALAFATKERIVLEVEKAYKQCAKPSLFFKWLKAHLLLPFTFPFLEAMDKVPAGPSAHHGDATAFDHTMEALDRAKEMDAPFHVFMAVLLHDAGKGTTDPDVLPHHYKHELRSMDIAEEFLAEHRFSKRVKEFAPKAAKLHMKAHGMLVARPKKLVKYVKEIGRRDFEDLVAVMEADHPLDAEQKKVLAAMKAVMFETDFSLLEEVPSKQRAQRAHEHMVREMKRRLHGE